MPPHQRASTHKRTQSLLLLDRLLSSQPSTSPLTLVLDSLAQSARPVVQTMLRRVKRGSSPARTVYVAFETPTAPRRESRGEYVGDVDVFVTPGADGVLGVRDRVVAAVRSAGAGGGTARSVVVFDSVYEVLLAGVVDGLDVASYLSSVLAAAPATALVLVCHVDVPLPPPAAAAATSYAPPPLVLLQYLATSILTTHSLAHVLAGKAARERSVIEPVFGLGGESEEQEGVLVGLGSNDPRGVVLEMEHRRKSGRSVGAWYFVPFTEGQSAIALWTPGDIGGGAMLLEDHPLHRSSSIEAAADVTAGDSENLDVSFNLGLTEKQRADREAVVLPYFDAQRDGGTAGPGEGGRILYDMGSEDDFDEEEDEI